MKFQIQHRFTHAVLFECELDANIATEAPTIQLGFAIKLAVKEGADLRGADLGWADLRGADLGWAYLGGANFRGADLRDAYLGWADLVGAYLGGANFRGADLRDAYLGWADLVGANFRGADLRDAYLGWADLVGADLRGANFRGADLVGANLVGANLEPIKYDMFNVLLYAIPEIPLLEKALEEGNIDGSTYEGECACLCRTIEKSGRFKGECDMRDASRPIERFFAVIKIGDTPKNSQFAKLAYDWLQEFKSLIATK